MMGTDERIAVWMEALEACTNDLLVKEGHIQDVSLKICRGESVQIGGLKQFQKKAFIGILGCMEKPAKGKYVLDYEDICLLEHHALPGIRHNKIGFMFKNDLLIDDMTMVENIQLPLQALNLSSMEKKKRIDAVIGKTGIKEIMPKKVKELQALDKRKAAFARAIVNCPVMVIADEPFYGLDNDEAGEISDIMSNLRYEGISLILFSEDLKNNVSNSRILHFKNGLFTENRDILSRGDTAAWA